jgi:hypothetical protein
MLSGNPEALRRYRRYNVSQVFYNDAEYMESTIFRNPPNYSSSLEGQEEAEQCEHREGTCQWTPKTIEFLQEVLPIASGFERGSS